MRRKRNGLFRLLCSLIPGAGEMYMGFLKMGVSIMSLFLLIFVLALSLHLGILGCVDIVVWFYSFFHVHSLAGLSDAEFYEQEDYFLFQIDTLTQQKNWILLKKYKNTVAAILIFLGIMLLLQVFTSMAYRYMPEFIYNFLCSLTYDLPRMIIGIAIIALGARMIAGKKQELESENDEEKKEEFHGTTK